MQPAHSLNIIVEQVVVGSGSEHTESLQAPRWLPVTTSTQQEEIVVLNGPDIEPRLPDRQMEDVELVEAPVQEENLTLGLVGKGVPTESDQSANPSL